jgi:hypothetical protein
MFCMILPPSEQYKSYHMFSIYQYSILVYNKIYDHTQETTTQLNIWFYSVLIYCTYRCETFNSFHAQYTGRMQNYADYRNILVK